VVFITKVLLNTIDVWWLPSMEEEVKCNVDDVLFKIDHCFGVHMCLQDVIGHFIKAKTARYDSVPSPMKVEAFGLKEAILLLG